MKCSGATVLMTGRVRDRKDPTRIPRSRNRSSESPKSSSNFDLSMNVNDEGKSIEVINLSTGQRRASLVA